MIETNKHNIFNETDNVIKDIHKVSKEWSSNILITGFTGSGKTYLMQGITKENAILSHIDNRENFICNIKNNGFIGLDEIQIYSYERIEEFTALAKRMKLVMVWVVQNQNLLSEQIKDLIEKLNFIEVQIND